MKDSAMPENHSKRYYIRTFGCQMNEHDSSKMGVMLENMGYLPSESVEDADLLLYNTCTIREKAHHKAISEIGRSQLLKKKNPNLLVGVCGCVAQQEKDSLFEIYPHLDLVFGPDKISKLPFMINSAINGERPLMVELVNSSDGYEFLGDIGRQKFEAGAAFVSIMKGCNCACSYCIVPKVRGREVCRTPLEIMTEINRLVDAGAREVTLLGQNVNAYTSKRSLDTNSEMNFTDLLRMISDSTGIERIRFTSPHPKDVSLELIEEYGKNEKLCPHIHLPIQSGSNKILKAMRRSYTRERYLEIAAGLKTARPGISITTDIIVGFCGEKIEDHHHTLDLMNEVKFDSSFAFKYSPRPDTEAFDFADDVDEEEKERRLADVLDLQSNLSKSANESLVGSAGNCLVYGMDRMKKGLLTGRMPDNRIIHFSGNPDLIGGIVRVRVTGAFRNSLKGELDL